jgi:hypothetical protein
MNFGALEQQSCDPNADIAAPRTGTRPGGPHYGRPCGPPYGRPNPGGRRPPMPRIMFFNMPPFIIFFMVFCM